MSRPAQSDPRQLGTAKVPSSLLPPTWRVMARNGRLSLPLDGANLHSFLTSVPDEEARRQVGSRQFGAPPDSSVDGGADALGKPPAALGKTWECSALANLRAPP